MKNCLFLTLAHLLTMASYSMSPVSTTTMTTTTMMMMIAMTLRSDKLPIVINIVHDDVYYLCSTVKATKPIQEYVGIDNVCFLKSRWCQAVVERAWRINLCVGVLSVLATVLHVHSLTCYVYIYTYNFIYMSKM